MLNRFKPFSLCIRGRLLTFDKPAVMGILNVTPDSFCAGSRAMSEADVASRVEQMIEEGADFVDVGACSTRPGSTPPTSQEELKRLRMALPVLREISTEIPVSVDTFRPEVAQIAVEELGADIVNDVMGCRTDDSMAAMVARLGVPYVLMHMRGVPADMQLSIDYPDGVTAGVIAELSKSWNRLRLLGVNDIIIDPGLGFAKTARQSYTLLRDLRLLEEAFGCPILVGVSRKSMLTGPLKIDPAEALPATVAANTLALIQGASILRVHDVAAARQSVGVVTETYNK